MKSTVPLVNFAPLNSTVPTVNFAPLKPTVPPVSFKAISGKCAWMSSCYSRRKSDVFRRVLVQREMDRERSPLGV